MKMNERAFRRAVGETKQVEHHDCMHMYHIIYLDGLIPSEKKKRNAKGSTHSERKHDGTAEPGLQRGLHIGKKKKDTNGMNLAVHTNATSTALA